MHTSEQLNELATALAKAQADRDVARETTILRSMFPLRKRAGCQHAKRPVIERLLETVVFGASDCWVWRGPVNDFGYGRMTFKGRTQTAHRVSYEAFVGAIPEGLSLLHSCDNPSCINPEHLSPGTYSDNRRDCQAKGRWEMKNGKRGFEHQSAVVTPALLERMHGLRESGLSYAKIGKTVGVSTMTAWTALNTRIWK